MLDRVHDRLREKTDRLRDLVDKSLDGTFQGETVLDRAVRHVLFADGKRIRASLALIGMEAAGGSVAAAVHVAAAFELLHTASLIHDDIMDSARVRRGRRCVHRVFGTRMAITAGDALIFEAYRRILLLRREHPAPTVERILQVFTACAARTCRGQAHDLTFPRDVATMRDYLAMVEAKTGSMIEAPLESVAILAAAPPVWHERFREYGRCLGIAFQVLDDAFDYLGSEGTAEKTVGHDVRNGRGSAIFIFCWNRCDAKERKALAVAAGRLRIAEDAASRRVLNGLFRKHGAIKSTHRLCGRYVSRAVRALDGVGSGPARAELVAIAKILGDWDLLPRRRGKTSRVST
jgi:geranylgeranyl diphosphate synthase, type I